MPQKLKISYYNQLQPTGNLRKYNTVKTEDFGSADAGK